jgi:hypothetical protein
MIDNQPIPPAPQSNGDANNDAADPKSNAIPEVKIPPSHERYSISCEKKRDKWDIAKLVVEFMGIVFLIIYTLYTAGIYCANQQAANAAHDTLTEVQNQTKILRQQLVGTQGVVLRLYLGLTKDGNFTYNINNVGVITASNISLTLKAIKKTLADDRQIGKVFEISPTVDPIKGNSAGVGHIQLPWRPIAEWPAKETIEISGTATYDDGFGDAMAPVTVCMKWLPHYLYTVNDRPAESGGAPILCADFKTALTEASGRQGQPSN